MIVQHTDKIIAVRHTTTDEGISPALNGAPPTTSTVAERVQKATAVCQETKQMCSCLYCLWM